MIARFSSPRIGTLVPHFRANPLPIFLFLFLAFPILLRAQNPNGALRGQVQDATAARVVGAHVALHAAGSSFSTVATTNAQGEFRIDGLLPGTYLVSVTANGFAQATANVEVTVSGVRDIDVILHPSRPVRLPSPPQP
jgi:hypothetical protein